MFLPAGERRKVVKAAMIARAMHRVDSGDALGAWEDLQAVHRIARHTARGATTSETLEGFGIEGAACRGDVALLEFARLSADDLRRFSADLDKLSPLASISDRIDGYHRFLYLDCVTALARDPAFAGTPGSKKRFGFLNDGFQPSSVDWNSILKWGNAEFDKLVIAARTRDSKKRRQIVDEIDEKFEAQIEKRGKGIRFLSRRISATEAVRDAIFAFSFPAVTNMGNSQQSVEARFPATRLAFAVEAFRADHGKYPTEITEVAPKYLPAVPTDPFRANASLIYKKLDTGFIVYSVGEDQSDDGGDDDKDVVVRLSKAAR
jgi:hypothetical protein